MKRIFVFLSFVISCENCFAFYNSTISNGCTNNVIYPENTTNRARVVAIFQINSYTCNNGYFLPANTEGCRACPSGYTCAGGTFVFNPTQSQGITAKTSIINNIQNGCSNNLLYATNNHTKIKALYEPKTVTVNWNDGVGGTQVQTTCTYDGLINLPADPVSRPGYTFSGWKLVTD